MAELDPAASSSNAGSSKAFGGVAAAPAKELNASQTQADARQERIAQLREQVRNGTYEVDAAKLSAKIIEAHLAGD